MSLMRPGESVWRGDGLETAIGALPKGKRCRIERGVLTGVDASLASSSLRSLLRRPVILLAL